MAHQVTWFMGRRIVYAQLQGDYVSLAEIQALSDQLLPFIRHSDPPYTHVIIDASFVTAVQSALLDQPLSYLHEPDLGWTIVIAPDDVAQQFKPFFGHSTRFDSFTSLEEGMFFLEDEDTSLLISA